ncbi:sensor histidine kinase, partial [Actinomadura sp. KC345]
MSTGLSGAWTRGRGWGIAVCVAAVLLVTALAGDHPTTDLGVIGFALVVTSGLVLAAARPAPLPVLAVTGLCALGYQAIGFEVPAVAYLFAVYAAVRAGHRIIAVAASVILLGAIPLAIMVSPAGGSAGEA